MWKMTISDDMKARYFVMFSRQVELDMFRDYEMAMGRALLFIENDRFLPGDDEKLIAVIKKHYHVDQEPKKEEVQPEHKEETEVIK